MSSILCVLCDCGESTLFCAAKGEPSTVSENDAGCIIIGSGRPSVVYGIREISSPEDIILWIHGEENKGFTRDFCEDGKDGLDSFLRQGVDDLVDIVKSRKVLQGFQGRRTEEYISF